MSITTKIKRLLYPLYIYPKITSKQKKKLNQLISNTDTKELENLRVFSNRNEDGIILRLFTSLQITKGFFVDIGSNDCINSNCANLVFNFEWDGIFIDADQSLLNIGKKSYNFFKIKSHLKFIHSFVYPNTINELISNNINENIDVDFLSIDIDGNDYLIWKALNCIKPKIVVVENKIEYGKYEIIVPVSEKFLSTEWGASIVSFTKLAEEKGYQLIATNTYGFNAFYMRNDCFNLSGLDALNVESVLNNKNISSDFYGEEQMKTLLVKI